MGELLSSSFVKPTFAANCFSCLPDRILEFFSSRRYDRVVCFLVDGFGWRFFETFRASPLLRSAAAHGLVEKITSQFPSTTSANITTLHTGLPVGEHAIIEWYQYEPLLDAVIAPLLFSFSGTLDRDTLRSVSTDPGSLYPQQTVYEHLAGLGVTSTVFQHREYTPSTYSDAMFRGSRTSPYRTLPEGLVNLVDAVRETPSPAFHLFYYDRIDAISHFYGPGSPQARAEILSFFLLLDEIFIHALAKQPRTLFILTADHGQVEVDPKTTIFLNLDPRFSKLTDFLLADRSGNPLVPAGSCRDFILYLKPGCLEDARDYLSSRLEGVAEVSSIDQMIAENWFGPHVSPSFRSRAGQLVILPYRGESVWWYQQGRFEQNYFGHHGGLTPEEMEIPLLMWEM